MGELHGGFRISVRHSQLNGLVGNLRDGLGLCDQGIDSSALFRKHCLDIAQPLQKLAFAVNISLLGNVDFRSIRIVSHDLIGAICQGDEITVCPRKLHKRSIIAGDEFGIKRVGFLVTRCHERGGTETDDAEWQNE